MNQNSPKSVRQASFGVRLLRFLYRHRIPVLIVVSVLLTAAAIGIGFGVFAFVCDRGAGWQDITSPADETIEPIDFTPRGNGEYLIDVSEYETYINPLG